MTILAKLAYRGSELKEDSVVHVQQAEVFLCLKQSLFFQKTWQGLIQQPYRGPYRGQEKVKGYMRDSEAFERKKYRESVVGFKAGQISDRIRPASTPC